MEITEGELRSPARAKSKTDSSRDFFPTTVWPNINWILPGVVLLVNITRLRGSSQTLLYFLAAGSLVRMTSWIEQRLLFPSLLRWRWSMNTDKALVDIIFYWRILPVLWIFKIVANFPLLSTSLDKKKREPCKGKSVSSDLGILYLAPKI